MSIQELFMKFKALFQKTEYQLSILIVVVAIGSFVLGRFSHEKMTLLETREVETTHIVSPDIEHNAAVVNSERTKEPDIAATPAVTQTTGSYVGSKNSTKYHLPWCAGAKQIKEENKIWFATKEKAEAAGYSPAANCKGI